MAVFLVRLFVTAATFARSVPKLNYHRHEGCAATPLSPALTLLCPNPPPLSSQIFQRVLMWRMGP